MQNGVMLYEFNKELSNYYYKLQIANVYHRSG